VLELFILVLFERFTLLDRGLVAFVDGRVFVFLLALVLVLVVLVDVPGVTTRGVVVL
jgi:hypothetical protein